MKLRTQLVLLVSGTAVLFLASVFAYFALLSPLETMQKEALVFQEVDRAASNLMVQANLLMIEPLDTQSAAFTAAQDRWSKSLEAVSSVTLLPQVSEEMAKAVQAVQRLGVLTDEGQKGVVATLDESLSFSTSIGVKSATSGWAQLYRSAFLGDLKPSDALLLQFDLAALVKKIQTLNQVLLVTQSLIEKKDQFIQVGLAEVKNQSSLVGLFAIVLAVIVAVLLSFLLAQTITKALTALGTTVARVGTGDLRVRLASRRKDELGALGRNIDAFL